MLRGVALSPPGIHPAIGLHRARWCAPTQAGSEGCSTVIFAVHARRGDDKGTAKGPHAAGHTPLSPGATGAQRAVIPGSLAR
jgi:hypothetical protein